MAEKISLAAKICRIMKDCHYVQKDGRNDFHKYNYASAANVLEKVNEACAEHGVASIPRFEIIASDKVVTVQCTLTLLDADSGETYSIVSLGSGQDAGDKAVAKAQTMALKYAWMTTLNISTGDDPEADEETDRANTRPQKAPEPPKAAPAPAANGSDKQRGLMFALAKEKAISAEALKAKTKELTGKESSKELTSADFSKVIDWLKELPKAS